MSAGRLYLIHIARSRTCALVYRLLQVASENFVACRIDEWVYREAEKSQRTNQEKRIVIYSPDLPNAYKQTYSLNTFIQRQEGSDVNPCPCP